MVIFFDNNKVVNGSLISTQSKEQSKQFWWYLLSQKRYV